MFRRSIHSRSFICIDKYLYPFYLMLMICTTYSCISIGCYQSSSKEKESWGVHFHKLYLCLFTPNVAGKLTPSQLVIYIRSSFSGCVRLEGKVILWTSNNERKHEKFCSKTLSGDVITFWFRERTETLPWYTLRHVCDFA